MNQRNLEEVEQELEDKKVTDDLINIYHIPIINLFYIYIIIYLIYEIYYLFNPFNIHI